MLFVFFLEFGFVETSVQGKTKTGESTHVLSASNNFPLKLLEILTKYWGKVACQSQSWYQLKRWDSEIGWGVHGLQKASTSDSAENIRIFWAQIPGERCYFYISEDMNVVYINQHPLMINSSFFHIYRNMQVIPININRWKIFNWI